LGPAASTFPDEQGASSRRTLFIDPLNPRPSSATGLLQRRLLSSREILTNSSTFASSLILSSKEILTNSSTFASSLLVAFLLLFLSPAFLQAAPVDLSPPPNALGYADANGNLKAVYKFGEIRFSDGFVLPLRFDFSSERSVELGKNKARSPFGWAGWHCGPLESSAEFYGGKKFIRATLLCSKILFLEQSKDDPNTYHSLGGSWTGKVEGDLLSVTRADGWDLRFQAGQVSSLRTDSGLLIEWQRDDKGRLLAIREKGQPLSGISLQWAAGPDQAPRVAAILGGEKPLASFTYRDDAGAAKDSKDSPPVAGSLSAVTNEASRSGFKFLQKEDSLHLEDQSGRTRLFTWNPANGRLQNDGMNRYRTLGSKTDPAAPKIIEMTNPKGETMARTLDDQGGETVIYPGQRSVTTTKFPQGSPAYGQIHQMIENVQQPKGEPDQKLVLMENTFDEEGKLIKRSWRGDPVKYKSYDYGRIEPVLIPDHATLFDVEEEKSPAKEEPLRVIEYGYDAQKRHVSTLLNGKEVFPKDGRIARRRDDCDDRAARTPGERSLFLREP